MWPMGRTLAMSDLYNKSPCPTKNYPPKPGIFGDRWKPMMIQLDVKIGIRYRCHRVADGKVGIGFLWHRVADANLTICWHRLQIGLQIG
jgi:hypothetical protein